MCKERLTIEYSIINCINPTNSADINNFTGLEDGMYAIFDGCAYNGAQIINGALWGGISILPSKYIKIHSCEKTKS